MAFDGTPSLGHNNPPLTEADFIAELDIWNKIRRTAQELAKEAGEDSNFSHPAALTVDEWRSLDPGRKLVAARRSELWATASYLREYPRADATLGVYKVICALSDNGKGYCNMAQERIGRFLGRGRQCINECIQKLHNMQLITIEEEIGWPARISPVIGKIFTKQAQTIWMLDALAPPVERRRPGRPKKIPVAKETTPISENPSPLADTYSEIPVVDTATQDSFFSPVVVEVEKKEININSENTRSAGNSLNVQAEGESFELTANASNLVPASRSKEAPQPPARLYCENLPATVAQASIVELELEEPQSRPFHERVHRIVWQGGHSPSEELKPKKISWSMVQSFKNEVRDCGEGHSAEGVKQALERTLRVMEVMIEDEPDLKKAIVGAKPCLTYFTKVLIGQLEAMRSQEMDRQANDEMREIDVNSARICAEIKIDTAKAQGASKERGEDERQAIYTQSAIKRNESSARPARLNGKSDGENIQSLTDDEREKIEEYLGYFNQSVEDTPIPQVKLLTEKRVSNIRRCLSLCESMVNTDDPSRMLVDGSVGCVFLLAIRDLTSSAFRQGDNESGWVADFDWFIDPNNFLKVLEESYEEIDTNLHKNGRYEGRTL
jgi:hypothetical protein